MNFLRKYLIRDGRVRLPDRIWLVAIIVFLLWVLVSPFQNFTLIGLIAYISAIFLTLRIKKTPILSTIGFTGITLYSTLFLPHNFAVSFWAIVFVSVLASSGHAKLAWPCAAVVVYANTVDLALEGSAPIDVGSIIANGLLFIGTILVGITIHQEKVKQAELEQQLKQRRDVLTRALHDSVAAKLSSVILRSETLGITGEVDPSTRATLTLIAEEARLAISDVRQLLEAMKTNNEFAPPAAHETLGDQVADIINLMESHKLRTIWTNQIPTEMLSITTPAGFSNVLSELSMNTIKYSPTESIVQIVTSIEDKFLYVEVINVVSNQQTSHYLTTGLGLAGIAEWAEKTGGAYRQEQHEDIWSAKVGFPTR